MIGARLQRVFETTEEVNRRAILDACSPRDGGTLLDLGCANGAMTLCVAERVNAARVLGVELIEPLAAVARSRGVEVTVADLGVRLPFPDQSIDVVHSNQVIEHLSATDRFMSEIRRVLRPDGYAVVSTNNLASLHNIVCLLCGLQPPPCHVSDAVVGVGNPWNFAAGMEGAEGQMHLRLFTARALSELAAYHGLRTELACTAGFYPFGPRGARVAVRLARRHGAFLVQRYAVAPRGA